MNNMKWLFWAMLSASIFAVQSVSTYYFTNRRQLNAAAVNTLTRFTGVVALTIYVLYKKTFLESFAGMGRMLTISPFITLLSSVSMLLGNITLYIAYSMMPYNVNAGLATGISNISIIISTVLAYILLRSKLTIESGGGIVVSVISLFIATAGIKLIKKTKPQLKETKEQKESPLTQTQYDWFTYSLLSALFYGLGMFATNALTKRIPNLNLLSLGAMIPLTEALIGLIFYISFRDRDISKSYEVKKYGLHGYSRDLGELISNREYFLNSIFNGACDVGGLIALIVSYSLAPNGGMADAVSGGYALLQAPLLHLVFGTPLDASMMLGLGGQLIGTMLMAT